MRIYISLLIAVNRYYRGNMNECILDKLTVVKQTVSQGLGKTWYRNTEEKVGDPTLLDSFSPDLFGL